MKLALTVLLASLVSASSKTISAKNAAKVLRSARRLEQNAENANQAVSYEFLGNYNLKLIGCKAGDELTDANGNTEYNAAIFRLCPSESGCNSDKAGGCKKGYGDFVVSLNTFVEAYFEDQRDNMNWDDQFQVDRYAQCGNYRAEQQEGGDNVEYFIGPTCTSDGTDVRLALFEDNTCTTESNTAFESISNGWTLPFSSGGMVSTACLDCVETNENGEAVIRDMCLNLYQGAVYACEAKMESTSYYGQNNEGCDKIQASLPKSVKSKKGGKVFGWLLFVLLIVGFSGYIVWWRKSKSQESPYLVEPMKGSRQNSRREDQPRRRWWQRLRRCG
jgi:hypothetical protein